MSLPRFSKVTLTIAEDGIAFCEANGSVRMLGTTEKATADHQWITDTLYQHADLLKGQTIDLVLANKFFRFTVMPWHNGVFKRNDWNALASHAFREHYGASADRWKMKVSFGQFGERAVATAIDQALYDGLLEVAKQLQFKWHSMEPTAMRLLNQEKRDYLATLIVEPQHLLLCEKTQSQFKHFLMMAPPAGEEATFAAQMLARWQLQQPAGLQANPVVVYVSGSLKDSWASDGLSANNQLNATVVMAKQKHRTNASWLTVI